MNTEELAQRYYEYSLTDAWEEAVEHLFSAGATSEEPAHTGVPVTRGRETILANNRRMKSEIATVLEGYISEPRVIGCFFWCTMGLRARMKDGSEFDREELAVLETCDGLIISQRFFY